MLDNEQKLTKENEDTYDEICGEMICSYVCPHCGEEYTDTSSSDYCPNCGKPFESITCPICKSENIPKKWGKVAYVSNTGRIVFDLYCPECGGVHRSTGAHYDIDRIDDIYKRGYIFCKHCRHTIKQEDIKLMSVWTEGDVVEYLESFDGAESYKYKTHMNYCECPECGELTPVISQHIPAELKCCDTPGIVCPICGKYAEKSLWGKNVLGHDSLGRVTKTELYCPNCKNSLNAGFYDSGSLPFGDFTEDFDGGDPFGLMDDTNITGEYSKFERLDQPNKITKHWNIFKKHKKGE